MAYNTEQRVTLEDTMVDVLHKISEGNPGAITVCMQVLEKGEAIDPDNLMGGLGVLLSFDTQAIYGSRIWMLYKDVCGEHIGNMLGVLRAVQLGFLPGAVLDSMIDGDHSGEETVEDLVAQVQERLPKFNPEPDSEV